MEKLLWRAEHGASGRAMRRLQDTAGFVLPHTYLKFLTYSNGGEGPLQVQPFYLCLNSAEEVVEIVEEGLLEECFPGLFVIGTNGAGEGIAIDPNSTPPFAVVYFDMTNANLDESIQALAADFDGLVGLVGEPDE